MPAAKRPRLRLIPVLMICCAALLCVKLQAIWNDRAELLGANSAAAATATGGTAPGAMSLGDFQQGPSASGPADLPKAAPTAPAPTASAMSVTGGPSNGQWVSAADSSATPTCSPDEAKLLNDLGARRVELDKRGAAQDRRDLLLKTVEQRIDGKLAQLQTMQGALKDLLGQVDQQQQDRLNSLVHIYETMKPVDAAGILGQMDVPSMLPILSRMRDTKTAPILAAMDPSKAREITLALAQNPPVPDGSRDAAQGN